MIVQKNFLGKLKDFGLNTYESKIWTALLSRGQSTAGELSDIANVPRSRSYDVLESLEKKGFIIMKLGKPIKYVAVPPAEVVERVKKRVREDADQHTKLLESLRDSEVLEELNVLFSQGIELTEPADLTGSFKGRPSVYTHLESQIKNAKESVTLMTTTEGLLRKSDALQGAMEKAAKRGVKIRIAAPLTRDTEAVVQELKRFAQVRSTKTSSRFCIVDNKQLTFMLMDDKEVHPTYDVGVWVQSPYFAGSFNQFFEDQWKGMQG
ncbi:MAG TPA: helix-turn-helix domain-containing protein [Candidatus Nanoarchaeia archaeon]|nr:helix-turn-helix domain-containing protein [Candidatus Nanoarchaeia archaeon]